MNITLDCRLGGYKITPPIRTVSLTCDNCGSYWSSDYGGTMWHEMDGTYTRLVGSFYPIVINFSLARPMLARMKQLNNAYDPGCEIMLFLGDDSNESEYNYLAHRLSAITDGKIARLPANSSTLLVDAETKRPVCPDCYGSILDILPF